METYEWKKNKAIVDRLYYTEMIFRGTTFAAVFMTTMHYLFIKNNYFVALSRQRIPKVRKVLC